MITTYIQIIQKYIKLYQKYPQNIAFLDNIARNDKRLRKNQSSPRRLVCSCHVPVPWQGWQGWQLHYFFSTFSIPSTSCSTRSTLSRSFELASLEKGPSLHSKMTLFGSSSSIVCHVPVPCHACPLPCLWLQWLNRMPYSLRNVHAISAFLIT